MTRGNDDVTAGHFRNCLFMKEATILNYEWKTGNKKCKRCSFIKIVSKAQDFQKGNFRTENFRKDDFQT